MRRVHPLIEGLEEIGEEYRARAARDGLFGQIYRRIRTNWLDNRAADRWPTADKNWVLRLTPSFTADLDHRLEKQLQKQIATCLKGDGWGNDVVTASGLVDSRGRQMNIDLAHKTADGFELIELKLQSNTPYEAALQILRYGAVYMLYRLEPELGCRLKSREMIEAKRITLEVLAPQAYYTASDLDLRILQTQVDQDVASFAEHSGADIALSFRFRSFPSGFTYVPGMDCEAIRQAVSRRQSPFANAR